MTGTVWNVNRNDLKMNFNYWAMISLFFVLPYICLQILCSHVTGYHNFDAAFKKRQPLALGLSTLTRIGQLCHLLKDNISTIIQDIIIVAL